MGDNLVVGIILNNEDYTLALPETIEGLQAAAIYTTVAPRDRVGVARVDIAHVNIARVAVVM